MLLGISKLTKAERSWILYDVANSAYTLIVVTVLFPILFMDVASASMDPATATAYTQYAKSFYSVLIALTAPVLGAYGDFKGMKKRLFTLFLAFGLIGGFLLCIPNLGWQAIIITYVFATVGYAGANIFYDAFLIDVTDESRMDIVSSTGYAMGYIGSTLPFIAGLAFYALAKFGVIDMPETTAISIAFLVCMIWWALFSIPLLKNVQQNFYIEKPEKPVLNAFARIGDTFKNIQAYKQIFIYLIAYFFYIDAVDTIISAAIPIGIAIGVVDDLMLVGIVLVIQFLAFPFAILYGRLTKRFGTKVMISAGILIYSLVCLVGANITNAAGMWVVAILVASAQGGIQAISRSHFGKLVPKEKSNEFFGFFNIFGKFAAIFGPLLVGIVSQMTGNPRHGMYALLPLLFIGWLLLLWSERVSEKRVVS